MNIEERALNLIDNAMKRIQSSIKNSASLTLLHQVTNENNLLRKISHLIHLLVTCNQNQFTFSNEIYEIIKKKHPEAPSDPQLLIKWIIDFLNYQDFEIQNFKTRLIQIELIIKKISLKVNNKSNPLMEQINDLKQKIVALDEEKKRISEENNLVIQDLQRKLKKYKDKYVNNQKEFFLLKSRASEADKINQTVEVLLEETKSTKIKQEEQCEEIKKKMQFKIEMLNEKCSLMRNDLNYALKQKFEIENANLALQDELQRKNAEILSLQAIIKDMNSSNRKIGSPCKKKNVILK